MNMSSKELSTNNLSQNIVALQVTNRTMLTLLLIAEISKSFNFIQSRATKIQLVVQ